MYYLNIKKIISLAKSLKVGLYLLVISILPSCLVVENEFSQLPPGIWRGSLELEPPLIEQGIDLLEEGLPTKENAGIYLPFLFEVNYDESDRMSIDFINGEERITIDHIDWGRSKSEAIDTFCIYFDVYDSYLTGKYNERIMQGRWVRKNRDNYSIPFVAYHGVNHRFETTTDQAGVDLSGAWACSFELESDQPYPAIGEFNQEGKQLTGTFRTETGDYRFLEGIVEQNNMFLSVFDGAHAFLFTAKFTQDTLLGTFYSGKHYKTIWSGRRDDQFELTNPDSITYLKPGMRFDFAFPDIEGNIKTLSDYKQPIKIVQITGTWCPNCRDETQFLVDYLEELDDSNLGVIALAFESYRDKAKSVQALIRYRDHFNLPYDILLAGYRDKAEASKTLPMLSEIVSYPTLIFLDQNNEIRKIHTGYNGPATSKYAEFVTDFDTTVKELLNEVQVQ